MTTDLLPSSASPLERDLAGLTGMLDALPAERIETIWDAWRCPAALLPWLAWALSVDVWDDRWGETVKRQAIADSPAQHRIKGTRRAIEAVVALSRKPYELTEWFDMVPPGRRGTAMLHIETPTEQIGATLGPLMPLFMAAKPKSRALFIGAGEVTRSLIYCGFGTLIESQITIEPYSYQGEDVVGVISYGAGLIEYVETILSPADYAGEATGGEVMILIATLIETDTILEPHQ